MLWRNETDLGTPKDLNSSAGNLVEAKQGQLHLTFQVKYSLAGLLLLFAKGHVQNGINAHFSLPTFYDKNMPLPVADEGIPQSWQKPITLQANAPKQIKQLFSYVVGLKIH